MTTLPPHSRVRKLTLDGTPLRLHMGRDREALVAWMIKRGVAPRCDAVIEQMPALAERLMPVLQPIFPHTAGVFTFQRDGSVWFSMTRDKDTRCAFLRVDPALVPPMCPGCETAAATERLARKALN